MHPSLRARSHLLVVAPLFLGPAHLARADTLLLSQPTVIDPTHVGLGFFSSSHPRPTRNFKRGDDFILAADSHLTRARWWGLSEGRVFDDLRNFDQYTIEIFEGVPAGGGPLPGRLVSSTVFAAAALSITPTGRISPLSGAAEHLYEAILPDVLLTGDRAYILAVSARSVNTQGDAWQWQDGEFFGGHGASYSYASRVWTSFEDTDSAFELFGTVVPGPHTGAVLLIMLATPRARRRTR
jgi:hypothetical protein